MPAIWHGLLSDTGVVSEAVNTVSYRLKLSDELPAGEFGKEAGEHGQYLLDVLKCLGGGIHFRNTGTDIAGKVLYGLRGT